MASSTVLPQHTNYPTNPLPIAAASKAMRRYYYPANNDEFKHGATSIVKLSINSPNMIDFNHSYLQCKFTNTSTNSVGLDIGAPFIKKVEIYSKGNLLETCGGDEYNRLYASLCQLQCNPADCGDEWSMTQAFNKTVAEEGDASFGAGVHGFTIGNTALTPANYHTYTDSGSVAHTEYDGTLQTATTLAGLTIQNAESGQQSAVQGLAGALSSHVDINVAVPAERKLFPFEPVPGGGGALDADGARGTEGQAIFGPLGLADNFVGAGANPPADNKDVLAGPNSIPDLTAASADQLKMADASVELSDLKTAQTAFAEVMAKMDPSKAANMKLSLGADYAGAKALGETILVAQTDNNAAQGLQQAAVSTTVTAKSLGAQFDQKADFKDVFDAIKALSSYLHIATTRSEFLRRSHDEEAINKAVKQHFDRAITLIDNAMKLNLAVVDKMVTDSMRRSQLYVDNRLDLLRKAVVASSMSWQGNLTLGASKGQGYHHNKDDQIKPNKSYMYNIPLVSAIFGQSKYFPLFLIDGLDLEITLEHPTKVGCWQAGTPISGSDKCDYKLSNVRYCAHEITVRDSGYAQAVKNMTASGALVLTGTTYKHYYNTLMNSGTNEVPISAGVNSLRALISKQQRIDLDQKTTSYSLSVGEQQQVKRFQYRIGGQLYPEAPIKMDLLGEEGQGEGFHELKKAMGSVHNFKQGSFLNRETMGAGYNSGDSQSASASDATYLWPKDSPGILPEAGCASNALIPAFHFGYSFEGFSRARNMDSGISTLGSGQQINLQLERHTNPNSSYKSRLDTFAVCDMMIYIGADGSMSTSA